MAGGRKRMDFNRADYVAPAFRVARELSDFDGLDHVRGDELGEEGVDVGLELLGGDVVLLEEAGEDLTERRMAVDQLESARADLGDGEEAVLGEDEDDGFILDSPDEGTGANSKDRGVNEGRR